MKNKPTKMRPKTNKKIEVDKLPMYLEIFMSKQASMWKEEYALKEMTKQRIAIKIFIDWLSGRLLL